MHSMHEDYVDRLLSKEARPAHDTSDKPSSVLEKVHVEKTEHAGRDHTVGHTIASHQYPPALRKRAYWQGRQQAHIEARLAEGFDDADRQVLRLCTRRCFLWGQVHVHGFWQGKAQYGDRVPSGLTRHRHDSNIREYVSLNASTIVSMQ